MNTAAAEPQVNVAATASVLATAEIKPRARVTVITATPPSICTKSFFYRKNFDGTRTLEKHTVADVYEGVVEVRVVDGLADFAALLTSLGPSKCLTYGLPPRQSVKLITQAKWQRMGQPDTHVARTKTAFSWAHGRPGVLMIDVDAPKDGSAPIERDTLIAAIRAACPGLADARMVWWPSTSSCIYDGETGEEIIGVRGHRLYILVQDAGDIERAGRVLVARLWLTGHGRIEISKSGSLLERSLVDASVWQSNRIDFAAGARCAPPLEQRRGDPVLIEGAVEWLDSRLAFPDLATEEVTQVEALKAAAKRAAKPDGDIVREAWIAEHETALVARGVEPGIARAAAERVVVDHVLPGDWPIKLESGETVTVGDLLDNKARYHGAKCFDPLEPGYDGGRAVGKLYLFQARPTLHSYAHGEQTFKLERQLSRIELVRGRTFDATNALLEMMTRAPDLYDLGDALVEVGPRGTLYPLSKPTLRHWVGGFTQFFKWKKDGPEFVEVLEDPPEAICEEVIALGARRGLRSLRAIVTAPTLRPDGSVLDAPGYDTGTGLLLVLRDDDAFVCVRERPSREDAKGALDDLWRPFAEFPFVGAVDHGAHLAALLTAAARPALPCAPGFAYDAPAQGSGKTLLAECVAMLAIGESFALLSPSLFGNPDEMQKALFAALRGGARVLCFDNVVGRIDSADLAAAMTAAQYHARVLKESRTESVPNGALFLMTGNNVQLSGELPRRFIRARIDPRMEVPFTRSFEIDPAAYCRANRQRLVSAALTLIRAYIAETGATEPGGVAKFEEWGRLVRRTVEWVGRAVAPGQFADPVGSLVENHEGDEEQESGFALWSALRDRFGVEKFYARDYFDAFAAGLRPVGFGVDPRDEAIARATLALGVRRDASQTSLGRVLNNRIGRIIGGLRLTSACDRVRNVKVYRLESVASALRLVSNG